MRQRLAKGVVQLFWTGYGILVILRLVVGILNRENSELPVISYLVQTGSMEPTILAGDVIFVRPQSAYAMNDIVTFHSQDGQTITHRIVEEDRRHSEPSFVTRGDNNRTEDMQEISLKQIVGKYWLRLPMFGFALHALSTPFGVGLFIGLPVFVLLGEQYLKKTEAGGFAHS